jgi:hypothetical protein
MTGEPRPRMHRQGEQDNGHFLYDLDNLAQAVPVAGRQYNCLAERTRQH